MKASASTSPLPLLRVYTSRGVPSDPQLRELPILGPRLRAIADAQRTWLNAHFVDHASAAEFETTLLAFYGACVPHALHVDEVRSRARWVRHGLAHLLHGQDSLVNKLPRFLDNDGCYHVAGVGPCFWSAIFGALEPDVYPAWLPITARALERLNLWPAQPPPRLAHAYAACRRAYEHIRSLAPALTFAHIDHFLCLVVMHQGRDLSQSLEAMATALLGLEPVALEHTGDVEVPGFSEARAQLEEALSTENGDLAAKALNSIGVPDSYLDRIDWDAEAETLTLWIGRLWEADDAYETLDDFWRKDPIPGAGLWLPGAVLHLKDPAQFKRWDAATRQVWHLVDDSAGGVLSEGQRYRLFNDALNTLCARYHWPAHRAHALLTRAADPEACSNHQESPERTRFAGFCADAFRFLAELESNNQRPWMDLQRQRYRLAVRGPLVELCRTLAGRYVEPILRRQCGWDLETAACAGRALTSICKNNYGRSAPYATSLWITYYPRSARARTLPQSNSLAREDVQLFVHLDASGLTFGLRLGAEASSARRRFRDGLSRTADLVYGLLDQRGAITHCRFGLSSPTDVLTGPQALRDWAQGREMIAGQTLVADDRRLLSDELPGTIQLAFDRLLPLLAVALEPDPQLILSRLSGAAVPSTFTDEDFKAATYLSDDWLRRARSLLTMKRQLILQGVPGTGKTHVARCLARLLTGGRDDAIRLVQFHPAYSYEEFVEGIKARSVETNGRHDITYPVEDGLLCAFAAEAAQKPDQPHVLIVDEINRGNLPRILGEMLYLLEYRDQSIDLPYSRRKFRLPANLYVIGTMNAADRSIALVDQALRRRFSFLVMLPDHNVLASWLQVHPPADSPNFACTVVNLLDRLNDRLRADAGPHCQIGHSYFMVPDLDVRRLHILWEHQIEPLLEDYFRGQPGRPESYGLSSLMEAPDEMSGASRRRMGHHERT